MKYRPRIDCTLIWTKSNLQMKHVHNVNTSDHNNVAQKLFEYVVPFTNIWGKSCFQIKFG